MPKMHVQNGKFMGSKNALLNKTQNADKVVSLFFSLWNGPGGSKSIFR